VSQMRIERNGRVITSLEEWRQWAPPKSADQWVPGRSAYECAYAWCGSGSVCMPSQLASLLDSREETRGLSADVVFPEHKIRFDDRAGEPRNADLAFVGEASGRKVAVTVEAKADEPFGASVARTICDALERSLTNPKSRGVARVEALVQSLLRPREKAQLQTGLLRYQLFTAVAGSLAWAQQQQADIAVLVVHEFRTDKTHPSAHVSNDASSRRFVERLAGTARNLCVDGPVLCGPFAVPGTPLFQNPVPLLIGKVTTDRREGRSPRESRRRTT
jgi:hypothetical protein